VRCHGDEVSDVGPQDWVGDHGPAHGLRDVASEGRTSASARLLLLVVVVVHRCGLGLFAFIIVVPFGTIDEEWGHDVEDLLRPGRQAPTHGDAGHGAPAQAASRGDDGCNEVLQEARLFAHAARRRRPHVRHVHEPQRRPLDAQADPHLGRDEPVVEAVAGLNADVLAPPAAHLARGGLDVGPVLREEGAVLVVVRSGDLLLPPGDPRAPHERAEAAAHGQQRARRYLSRID
jgi:hypothetical protein